MPTERQLDIILESELEFKTFKEEPMNNNKLPAETQERIKADAEAYVQRTRGQEGRVETYIAGATAENNRAKVLVDGLRYIQKYYDTIDISLSIHCASLIKEYEQWREKEVELELKEPDKNYNLSTEEKKKLLANKIEARMKEVGLQPQEFADLMGTQPSTITQWLSGEHNFQIDTLFEIEKQLNISLFNL